MLNVIKDQEINNLTPLPDQLSESTNLTQLQEDISKQSGKKVVLERQGENVIVRQLLID
jgi:hypothetical protein